MPDITLYMAVNTYIIGFMFTIVFCYAVDLRLMKGDKEPLNPTTARLVFSLLWFVTLPLLLFFVGKASVRNNDDGNWPDDF